MSKIYFTLTGTNYFHGNDFLKPGMKLKLKKQRDNEYDKEAIVVKMEGLGEIGHVANSTRTVIGDSMSAGRLYDKIGEKAKANVVLVTQHGTICRLSKKSLIGNKDVKLEKE
ncbi:MAG: HIRAN domain-containing protein [Eubacteriales bacterium]|nr:HIRAN domain-containing protein [Eubacteriales bacterium]